MAQSSEQALFTSARARRSHVKRFCQRSAESPGFLQLSGFLPQEEHIIWHRISLYMLLKGKLYESMGLVNIITAQGGGFHI
jgi:hypothetical protein